MTFRHKFATCDYLRDESRKPGPPEKFHLPPAQARAILRAMDSELAAHDSALATKSNLSEFELKIDLKIEGLRTEMQKMRAELIREIKGTTRWNFAFWVVQLGAIAGLLKLVR